MAQGHTFTLCCSSQAYRCSTPLLLAAPTAAILKQVDATLTPAGFPGWITGDQRLKTSGALDHFYRHHQVCALALFGKLQRTFLSYDWGVL